jgi:hypothetical protein
LRLIGHTAIGAFSGLADRASRLLGGALVDANDELYAEKGT